VGNDTVVREVASGRAGVSLEMSNLPVPLVAPLIGKFQLRNLAVAAHTALALTRRGIEIPDSALVKGAANVRWPGRMQWIDGSPSLLVDGCHNTEAVGAMVEAAGPLCDGHHVVAVFGAMADKELGEMLDALRPLTADVVFTAPATPRAAPAQDLVRRWGAPARTEPNVAAALAAGTTWAGSDGVVVAFGSLYIAGEALQASGALAPGGLTRIG
jgi:dihydrofolate synthase/folylpolyglutamate synthase